MSPSIPAIFCAQCHRRTFCEFLRQNETCPLDITEQKVVVFNLGIYMYPLYEFNNQSEIQLDPSCG